MENVKNKNYFLIVCVSCIVLLLTMCYFGVNSSIKGTSAATTYANLSECATEVNEYISDTRKCDSGVVTESKVLGISVYKCCPTADFSYSSGSGNCIKYYDKDSSGFNATTATAECEGYGDGYIAYNMSETGVAQCVGSPLGNAKKMCNNGTVFDDDYGCCPSGTTFSSQGYCVTNGWYLGDNTYGSFPGVSTELACVYEGSSTNSGTTSSKGCYCVDTETGHTCKYSDTHPGDNWTLTDDSYCSDSDESTISFNANGGTVGTSSKSVVCNSTYGTLPTPTRTGYKFKGWYTSYSGGTKITSSSVFTYCSSQTLYAQWESDTYTISFNANEGTVGTSSKSVICNSTYGALPTPTRTGYEFKGWYTSSSGGTKITSSSIFTYCGSQTLYAQWESDTYTISFDANEGTVSTSSKSVACGSEYGTLPTPTRTDYEFKGWYTSSSGGTKITSSSIFTYCGNQTLHAQWTANDSSSSSSSTSKPSSSSASSSSSSSTSSSSSSSITQTSSSSVSSSTNTNYNPETGEITIFVVWVIALAAVVYSVWYFRKVKENQ